MNGNLHGMRWITIHYLPKIASSPPLRGRLKTRPGAHNAQNVTLTSYKSLHSLDPCYTGSTTTEVDEFKI